ncbi:hypothetical protein [Paenibacillus sp. NPDC058177]|uniref:hypothetical protein n=1 Tax=Paenibacillus sp. NPDC058177 TaxID=3346369 RepID=UPI0036DA654B
MQNLEFGAWLLSNHASFITGVILPVENGLSHKSGFATLPGQTYFCPVKNPAQRRLQIKIGTNS